VKFCWEKTCQIERISSSSFHQEEECLIIDNKYACGVVRGEGQVSREDLHDLNFEHCLSQ